MKLQLTQRDLRLLEWINTAGFVTIDHIAGWLNTTKPTAYLRTRKLVHHGYLSHQRILHAKPGIYRVTKIGLNLSGSELPLVRNVVLSTYQHDLFVITLSLLLTKRYQGTFMTERELKHTNGSIGVGSDFIKTKHVADGVLIIDDKQIAIEVELNKKSKRRRESIFKYYVKTFDFKELWYFCKNEAIAKQIEPYQKKSPFIKIIRIKEFLSECGKSNEAYNKLTEHTHA